MMNAIITNEPGIIRTVSGKFINILNPQPDDICIEDIAHALSHLCRFGGHTPKFFSVAEHCICCMHKVEAKHKFAALMHDASEAYLIDLPSPIKRVMPDYLDIEDMLMKVIAEKFGFEYPLAVDVLRADRLCLEMEWAVLVSGNEFSVMVPGDAKQLFLATFNALK